MDKEDGPDNGDSDRGMILVVELCTLRVGVLHSEAVSDLARLNSVTARLRPFFSTVFALSGLTTVGTDGVDRVPPTARAMASNVRDMADVGSCGALIGFGLSGGGLPMRGGNTFSEMRFGTR